MIIDAHTHFYDPTRPQGVPWPSPQDDFLYRKVLPEHYKAAAAPEGVTGAVMIEASAWIEDNAWALELAAGDPFVVGVVGHLEPGQEGFAEHLDRFAANPLFRGIRVGAGTMATLETPAVMDDLGKLADRDLELDLLIQTQHLPAVATLAARLPELRLGVNHVAAVRIDGNAPDPAWAEGVRAAGESDNVWCKVSALTWFATPEPAPVEVDFYAPTLDALWEAFGEDRLVYGSDWPVSARKAAYPVVQSLVDEYFSAKGGAVREKFFRHNAKALYRWPGR